MVKISACVITKNEEAHIEQWLNTMRRITKDLIVVDTGSTDRTVALAKAGGARVYHFEWIDDFSAAKNYAIERAKGDWIVFLDADEYFTEASVPNVRKVIERQHRNSKADVLVCKIIDVDADKDNAQIDEFYNLRIFRNVSWLRYRYKVHEQLTKKCGEMQVVIVENEIEILHTGYTQSIIKKKFQRNLALLQKEIAEQGEFPRHYRFLCECYYGLEEYELALKYARLHVAKGYRSLGKDNGIQKKIIDCLYEMKAEKEEILEEINAQIMAHPDDPELLWYKAEYLARFGQYAQAEVCYAQMFMMKEQQKRDFDTSSFEGNKVRAYARLTLIAVKKGDFMAAEASAKQALRCAKYNETLFLRWYRWVQRREAVEVISALGKIYDKTERDLLFIYKLLQAFPRTRVHLYYQNILKEKLGIHTITSDDADLFGAGQYKRAAAVLKEIMETEYAHLLLCAALNKDLSENEQMRFFLPEPQKRVLHALRGEAIVLTLEETKLYEAVQNRLMASRGDLKQPLEALRARYLGAQRQVEVAGIAGNTSIGEKNLLQFIEPSGQQVRILALDCDEKMLMQLKELCPQAVIQKKSAMDLAVEEKELYQWIILGEPLNSYRRPVCLLNDLYKLLRDGSILFTVENARYWKYLKQLLQEEKGFFLQDIHQGKASFTATVCRECLRATKFSDIAIDAEETDPVWEASDLLTKLQSVGLLADARDFYTRCWHVCAGKMAAVSSELQSVMSLEERRSLVFLLRQVENELDTQKSMEELLRFCDEKKVEAAYLAALIDNSMIRKTKLLIQVSVFFYEQGAQQKAVRMLIAALHNHMQESEFVCTLALLLQLSGARKEALKVLAQFGGEDASVEALRKELMA